MDEKIRETMSAVFGIDVSKINADTSPEDMAEWDSIKHIQLIQALERVFDIEFDDDEIADMLDYSLVREAVVAKTGG